MVWGLHNANDWCVHPHHIRVVLSLLLCGDSGDILSHTLLTCRHTDDSDQFDLSEYLADDHQTNELTKNQTMKNRNKNHDDLPTTTTSRTSNHRTNTTERTQTRSPHHSVVASVPPVDDSLLVMLFMMLMRFLFGRMH
mmetsp:Transcript_13150/g.30637  ORF Transcript_13150/g.30637 Transcript_13150/m.30637 type:complete len:138 (-) Transcript_13150:795-1208(-)